MSAVVAGKVVGHSVEYGITGTPEEITSEIADIMKRYPPPGYGTWFNWPPGGPNKKYYVPRDLGDGRWLARGHRSTSSD